ncbi:21587_t:CDS:1, partial [Racocetra persica]
MSSKTRNTFASIITGTAPCVIAATALHVIAATALRVIAATLAMNQELQKLSKFLQQKKVLDTKVIVL